MERDNELIEVDLNRPENFVNSVEYKKLQNGGRRLGCQTIPPTIRSLIGAAAALGDEKKEVAEAFGITKGTVDKTLQGKIGGDRFDPELKKEVEKVKEDKREKVAEAALTTLAELLANNITPAVLGTMKPMEQVHAAKSLAEIAERVQEKKGSGQAQQQFIIFRPTEKEESDYPSIDIVATPAVNE